MPYSREAELVRRSLAQAKAWRESSWRRVRSLEHQLEHAKSTGDVSVLQLAADLAEARRLAEQAGKDVSSALRVCRMMGA
jgi:hypothetical protein